MNNHIDDWEPSVDRKTAAELREEIEELQLKLIFREAEEDFYDQLVREAQTDPRVIKWKEEGGLRKFCENIPTPREKKRRKPKSFFPIPKRAASVCAVFLIFLIGAGTGFAASNYLQRQAGAFVMTQEDGNLDFRFQMAQETLSVPAEWQGEYFPARIPDGFELAKVSSVDSNCSRAYYENSDRISITFGELGTETIFGINAENAAVTREEIGGRMATISETENSTVIVFMERDKILIIEVTDGYFKGYEHRNAAMQIAESILFLQ